MADEPIREQTLRRDAALDRYWDAIADGRQAAPAGDRDRDLDLDERLAATIRRVHALAGQPLPEPDRADHLWRNLMSGYASTAPLRLAPSYPQPINGHEGKRRPAARPIPPRSTHRRVTAALSVAATAALVAAVLLLVLYTFRRDNNVAVPPAQETPTPAATPTADWPIFRGNPERNGAMPGPGPNGEPVILWQFEAGSATRIAPVLAEGMVFLSADDDDLFALDVATGTVRWQVRSADSPIAAGGGIVYGLSEDVTALVAWDTVTAEELWRVGPGSGFWSPLVVGDTFFYGGDPHLLAAYDARTGEVRWRSAQSGFASRSAALADGVLVVGAEDHHVYGIDQATGTTRWAVAVGGAGTLQTPAILNGVAHIGAFGDASNVFLALDLQTGRELWRFTGVDGEGFWAPGAAGDLVFVPSDGGRLYALDAATGLARWTFAAGGPMKSAPAIVDGVVYAAGDEGILVALDTATGAERWRMALDGAVTFGPVVADGVLYVGTANGVLYAIVGQDDPRIANATPEPPAATATPHPTDVRTPPAAVAEFVWAATGSDQTRLTRPMVARLAPDGSLWVSDLSGRFFIFDLDGNLLETWGAAGSDPGQFRFAERGDFGGGFAFASDGSLYVADTFNQRVQHFDRDRQFVGSFGSSGNGDGQFLAVMGIAIDPDGNLVVVDAYRADVQRFRPDGTFLGRFDGTGTPGGRLQWPNGIAVAADGGIWVGDLGAGRVRKFSPDGQEFGELDASASTPSGFLSTHDVVVDRDGFVYVAVQDHNAVKVFDPAGRFVAQWGTFGSGEDGFNRPAGIAVNRGGTVYVADHFNGRVQKFRIVGSFPPPAAATPAP